MTKEQKIELIMKSPNLLESELTEEEYEFLYETDWEEAPEEEKRLWFLAWQRTPNTLEHATATIDPAEIATAAEVLRTIRGNWIKGGLKDPAEFDKDTSAGELLEILEQTIEEAGRK